MNDQLEIRTNRDYINWQLDQPLDASTIKNQLAVQVVDHRGNPVDAEVIVMTKAVNVNQVGTYTATLVAEDNRGDVGRKQIEVNVVELRSRQQATNSQPTVDSQPTKKRHKWLIIGVIVVLIICCLFAIRSCQNRQAQQANNATQSSQISDNSSSIANNSSSISKNSSSIEKLKGDNAKLAQQVAALRGAVQQYKEDHDQQALQTSLNNIEQQNNQIQSSLSQTNQNKLNQVTQAAQNIAANPDNADSEIQNLKENGFGQLWDNITSQVQTWLNQHN